MMKLSATKHTALFTAAVLALCTLAACGAARAAESTLGSASVTQSSGLVQSDTSAQSQQDEAEKLYLSQQEMTDIAVALLQKGFGYADANQSNVKTFGTGEQRGRACRMFSYDSDEPDAETGFGVVVWVDCITGKIVGARDSGRRSREINDMLWPAFASADSKTWLPTVDRTAPGYEAFATAMCDKAQSIVLNAGLAGDASIVRCDYAPPDANREPQEGAEPLAVRVTLSDNTAYQFTMNPRTFALWDCDAAAPITD